jgi:hypothetical protein
VFAYDMSNTQKSWIGRPNNNTCNYDTYNWTDGNATVTRGVTPPIAPPVTGYEISKIQSNNGGDTSLDILYTSSVDQVNGGVYTHSAWILLTAGTYCRVGQHWNPWDAGTAWYIPLNVWTRVSYTVTNSTNNYGSIANAYGTDGTIYVTAVQYEKGSTMTPFMGGAGTSRSTSQAIKDLTGNNTITASNLTYNSDNTFQWDGGVDARLQSPSSSLFAFGTGDFTVECWINPTNFSGYTHMVALPDQNTFGLKANTGDGAIYFYSSAFTTYPTTGWTLTTNTWNHVVLTRASSVAYCYLNGNLMGSKSGFTNNFTAQTLNIGNGYGTEWTYKKIGSVKIYNRGLTSTEVAQNFNNQRSRYGI